jgi:chromate transporter
METAAAVGLKRKLFLSFAKIGLFTFGGGYAMISLIESECVEKKKWITHDEMMNITVIAESTPGPIAINCATYVGYKQSGLMGAVLATLGMVLPSFTIIYLISKIFDDFLSITLAANAFKGIKVAVGLLILNAAITMIRKMPGKPFPRMVMLLSCFAMLLINALSLRLSSIYIMLTAGVFSFAMFFAKTKLRSDGESGI